MQEESKTNVNLDISSELMEMSPDTPPRHMTKTESQRLLDIPAESDYDNKKIPTHHVANSRPYCELSIEIPSDSEVDEDEYMDT